MNVDLVEATKRLTSKHYQNPGISSIGHDGEIIVIYFNNKLSQAAALELSKPWYGFTVELVDVGEGIIPAAG